MTSIMTDRPGNRAIASHSMGFHQNAHWQGVSFFA